jgi:hypothetical protein
MKEVKTKRLTPQEFVGCCNAVGVSKMILTTGKECVWFYALNVCKIWAADGNTIVVNEDRPANDIALLHGVDFLEECADYTGYEEFCRRGFKGFYVCKSCDNKVEAAADGMIWIG